jgi:preprotein translocase subunit SecD
VLNTYPIWKNLLVVFAITLGVIYALPNIYPPDYAVQVSSETSGVDITEKALKAATSALDDAELPYFGTQLASGSIIIRLPDDDTQLKAKTVIQRALHDLPQRFVVALNSAPTTPEWLTAMRAEPMKYGLDLRGGVHFLMEVDTENVVTDRIDSLATDVKRKLREGKLRYKNVNVSERGVLKLYFEDNETRIAAQTLLESQYREFLFASGSDSLPFLSLTITDDTVREIEDFAVSQNLQTIRNRVNELGVSEPLVQRLGRNRIVVDLPGVQDTAEAKRILGKVATLEFRFDALADAPRSTTLAFPYQGRTANLERNVIIKGDRVVNAQVALIPSLVCRRSTLRSTAKVAILCIGQRAIILVGA